MNDLDKNTEALLNSSMVTPPAGFRDTVMQRIAAYEREQSPREYITATSELQAVPWWQWVALTAGGVLGVGQVFRFILSVWFATTAG